MSDDLAIAILEELKAIRAALEDHRHDGLLTAAEAAKRLGVGREWIYAHQEELGAVRLPSATGQRPRLRFDAAAVTAARIEALTEPELEARARRQIPKSKLLPIGGQK